MMDQATLTYGLMCTIVGLFMGFGLATLFFDIKQPEPLNRAGYDDTGHVPVVQSEQVWQVMWQRDRRLDDRIERL